jgi:hypothetical protein
MGELHQSVLRRTPFGDIELASKQFSEKAAINGHGL